MKQVPWRVQLLLILLVAAGIRFWRLSHGLPVVEGDGAEYARIAENLASGEGYVGLLTGKERMLPPLYSVAIAGVLGIFGDASSVDVGRSISFASGLLCVLLMALLAAKVDGRRAGAFAGLVAALHPALVVSSTAVFAESLHLAMLLIALLAFFDAVHLRAPSKSLVAGLFFGFAYLARVEAFALAGLSTLILGLGFPRRGAPERSPLPLAAALVAGFLIAASPYVAHLKDATGEFRLEGKGERVFATIARSARGMNYAEANYGLGDAGEAEGPWLSANTPFESEGLLATIAANPRGFALHYASNLLGILKLCLTGHTMCSPLFLLVIALALWRRPKGRAASAMDVFLVGLLLYVFLLGGLYKIVLRYIFLLVLPSCLYSGRILSAMAARLQDASGIVRAIPALAVLALCLSASRGIWTGFKEFDEALLAHAPIASAGMRIAGLKDHEALLSVDARLAFYGRTTWFPLPAAPSAEALRQYAAKTPARLLAVDQRPGRISKERPGPWFDAGNPPPWMRKVLEEDGVSIFEIRP